MKGVTEMLYKKIASIIILSGLILPAGVVAPPVVATGSTVVINELLWTGSSASSADEWIELRNTTDLPIDVSNWSLTKKSSGADVAMLTIPAGKTIAPHGFFLISNYANTSASSTLNGVPDVISSDVALSNTALQLRLLDASQQLVDVADDGVGNPLAGALDSTKKIYASMERNPVSVDGTQAASWHTASRGVGFKTGAPELGTPGSVNSNGIPIAHAGADQTGVVGQALNFDGSDSFDPELQPLTFAWDFGDGGMSNEAAPKHTYAAAGAYTVTITVTDGVDNATDTAKVTITPAPAATTPSTSPDPSSSEEGNSDAAAAATSCLGLHLTEVYPNPPGVDNDEFIELMNDSDEEIVTGSCAVFTSATRSYKIPSGKSIARGSFLLLPKSQTHLTMNNGGTTVRLVDSDGTELDRIVYGVAKEGQSWAKFPEAWSWTAKPTPGAVNVSVVPSAASTKTTNTNSATKKTTKAEPPAQTVTLKDVQELDSGDRVVIRGVVTVPRDALGSTVAYLQTEDGGISITIPSGEQSIQLGQTIELTGTVRLKNGRRYVATTTKSLKVISTASEPTPVTLPTDDVGIDQADQLVHVKGVVSLASGSRIEIDDGSGPVSLYIKSSTGIVRPKVKAGDTVDAVGIVAVSTSGIRILPRSQSDLRVEQVLGVATTSTTPTAVAPAASRTQTIWYWSLVALGALAAGAKPLWKSMKQRREAQRDQVTSSS